MTTPDTKTADFLLRQIRFLKRVGTPAQKQAAPKWERLIIEAAAKEQPQAVNFATGQELKA